MSELRSESNPEARFDVFDSSLSEEGVLGFEYGYTVVNHSAPFYGKRSLVILVTRMRSSIEYIAASEDKWKQTSRLVMLLPHGYEGQGPEHSSARLERYLQLCAGKLRFVIQHRRSIFTCCEDKYGPAWSVH